MNEKITNLAQFRENREHEAERNFQEKIMGLIKAHPMGRYLEITSTKFEKENNKDHFIIKVQFGEKRTQSEGSAILEDICDTIRSYLDEELETKPIEMTSFFIEEHDDGELIITK